MAVVLEALALVLVALPLGLLLAQGIAYGIETTMPLYLIPVTEPLPLVRTAIACMLFAVVGALTPVRLIRRLDPSLVFRS
jgi:ABC-type antimicrobial peptide transport system permease subunit